MPLVSPALMAVHGLQLISSIVVTTVPHPMVLTIIAVANRATIPALRFRPHGDHIVGCPNGTRREGGSGNIGCPTRKAEHRQSDDGK
ncbi:hypothetical protein [Methylorubrum extorquens]|uniref:hypothetical protein n=1 Tax=Methylorubrum extorquens TaxID=408 RepID=UPI001237217D|nr:hypothetical protein [Methylorubrum extorquens]WIU40302.1 hypothetical protein KQ926_02790 [Methylorubrum extorquens]